MTKTSSNQLFMLFFVFLVGASMAFGGNSIAKRDSWISIIIGTLLAVVVYLIYIRIFSLNKDKNLFEINVSIFGEKLGKLVNYIYGIFSFCSSVISVLMISFFINTVSLINTKPIVISIAVITVCFITVLDNSESLAKFPQIVGSFIFAIIVISLLLSLNSLEIENILPVLEMGWGKVLEFSFSTMMLPFLEGFFIISLFYRGEKKQKKVIILSLLTAGTFLLLSTLRNLMVFGFPGIKGLYFPSYSALSLISFGEFFQRQEVLVSIVFAICYVLKCSIFLCFSAKAINIKSYKINLIIVSVLVVFASYFVKSIMMLFQYILIYKNLLVLPLIIMPVLTWILSERKKDKKNGT